MPHPRQEIGAGPWLGEERQLRIERVFAPPRPGYPGFHTLCEQVRPTQATLVPDPPDVLTSNAGWDLREHGDRLRREVVPRLRDAGCRVSLFLDPDAEQARRAAEAGADRIELYTESYARAYATPRRPEVFAGYRAAAEAALEAGLGINAGHDLNLENLGHLAANLPGLLEVHGRLPPNGSAFEIGHAGADLLRDAIEALSSAIVAKILHAPITKLRESSRNGAGRSWTELVQELFGLGRKA